MLGRFFHTHQFMDSTYTPIQYFDWNILRKRKNALYVDCGAYDGDSVVNFVGHYGSDYAHIVAYEPTPDLFRILRQNSAAIPRVALRNAAVGEKSAILPFRCFQSASLNFLPPGGESDLAATINVPVVVLDQDIDPAVKISLLKMDIEGGEVPALKGAREHIIRDKPQLAICVYHLLDDLRVIPRLIHSYNSDQDFYLRNHRLHFSNEVVFYADPRNVPDEESSALRTPVAVDEQLRQMLELSATVYEGLDYLTQPGLDGGATRRMRDLIRQALTALLRSSEDWDRADSVR
jgi:FkbM family methyltransferase